MIYLGLLQFARVNKSSAAAHNNDERLHLFHVQRNKEMQRRNHSLSKLIIGAFIASFFTGENLAQENLEWKDRFYTEAPKRWADYLRFAQSLQITVTSKAYKADRSLKRSVYAEIKQTKGAFLRVVHRKVLPQKQLSPHLVAQANEATVEGANPFYSFKLKRRSPDSAWIIMDLEFADKSTNLSDKQRNLQEEHLRSVCDGLMLENVWLPSLIQDPDFKITTINTQENDGQPVVRFDFDYPKLGGGQPIKGGWMVLDPKHDWILREYVVHSAQPQVRFHQIFQMREGAGRHPIVTQMTWQLLYKNGEKQYNDEKEYKIVEVVEAQMQAVEQSDLPIEEFTLSAFGLPEPPGTQVGKSRLHLWIALAGIVCLGIAALIRWQLQRTRTPG